MTYVKIIKSDDDMKAFGQYLGERVRGGELFELIGDVGVGKTTLTKGLAAGMRVDEDVQSPSFTINRTYSARNNLELHHYDFYRLSDPGIVSYELAESVADSRVVTVIEWSETVQDVLPIERIVVHIAHEQEDTVRRLEMTIPESFHYLEVTA